jgi:ribonuclease HI
VKIVQGIVTHVYTDGSCGTTWPKLAAYAVYVPDTRYRQMGTVPYRQTNNRGELLAVINGIQYLVQVKLAGRIFTDSEYVSKGVNSYMLQWQASGWVCRNKLIENAEMWQVLCDLVRTTGTTVEWIKAHAEDSGNNEADRLANLLRLRLEHEKRVDTTGAFLLASKWTCNEGSDVLHAIPDSPASVLIIDPPSTREMAPNFRPWAGKEPPRKKAKPLPKVVPHPARDRDKVEWKADICNESRQGFLRSWQLVNLQAKLEDDSMQKLLETKTLQETALELDLEILLLEENKALVEALNRCTVFQQVQTLAAQRKIIIILLIRRKNRWSYAMTNLDEDDGEHQYHIFFQNEGPYFSAIRSGDATPS